MERTGSHEPGPVMFRHAVRVPVDERPAAPRLGLLRLRDGVTRGYHGLAHLLLVDVAVDPRASGLE